MARGVELAVLVLFILSKSETNGHQKYHIHQHNGKVTSLNSSDIIREEGLYFLNQIFEKYGSGDVMDLSAVETVLRDIGYASPNDDGNSSEHDEHPGHKNTQGTITRRGENEDNDDDQHRKIHEKVNAVPERNEFDVDGSGTIDSLEETKNTAEGTATGQVNSDPRGNNSRETVRYNHKFSSEGTSEHDEHKHSGKNEHPADQDRTGHSEGEIEGRDNFDSDEGKGNDEHHDHFHTAQGDGSFKSDGHHSKGKSDTLEHEHVLGEASARGKGDNQKHHTASKDVKGDDQGEQKQIQVDFQSEGERDDGNNKDGVRRKSSKQKGPNRRKGKGRKRKKKKGKGKSRNLEKANTEPGQRNTRSVVFHLHDVHTDCMSVKELLKNFHFDEIRRISHKDFLYMSPAIVYQMSKSRCRHNEVSSVRHAHGIGQTTRSGIPAKVWGFSALAVFIISLVGLMAVALVPVIQKLFFDNLIQFLVAMAVGALTGDAMLHLLPHAIDTGHGSGADDHKSGMWKGLCGLAAIYFFFIIQRVLGIITGVRNKRKQQKAHLKKNQSLIFQGEPEVLSPSSKVRNELESDSEQTTKLTSEIQDGHHDQTIEDGDDHGHSHGPAPTSVSAIAMMIVLGDGIHNFSDGLAIGVAFGTSITSGISTGIAVFCHELPHEIGDFAVLLKSGMTVKRAILYNCVSSVLCFVGMLIGVALGNMEAASSWIFAAVGGMFIYISLVTMMPELSSGGPRSGRNLLLQMAGIGVGSGIMLLIAVFEEDLKSILG